MSCGNPKCDNGWVAVGDAYVTRVAPEPTLPEGEGPEMDAIRKATVLAWQAQRAAAAETVYPCKACQPALFFRWCEGHLDPAHDRFECDDCDTPGHGRTRRKGTTRSLAAPTPPAPEIPTRADIDL